MKKTRRILELCGIVAVLGLVLLTKLACGHQAVRQTPPPATTARAKTEAPEPIDPTAPVQTESLGVPVRAARTWTSALAPNNRGGWNFITQTFELDSGLPTEYTVVDLDTGKYSVTEGPPGAFAHSNFRITNQLRAPNGRIFFLEFGNRISYYDPADETVHELGSLIPNPGANRFFHSGMFGVDGKLYAGTESNKLPTVVQLDPVTLKSRVLGEVGHHRIGYSYAYYLAVDPPWVYVAVGENPWELAALNLDTGESKILAERGGDSWIKFKPRPEGITAVLITNHKTPQEQQEILWCVDGKTLPFDPQVDRAHLPFKPRNAMPIVTAIKDPPEIDMSASTPDNNGDGRVKWRPHGSDAWNETRYRVKHTSAVEIESLTALPDGTLLGNAQQYHGFFRYNPVDQKTTYYGPHRPSKGARAILNGLVYITGYPNGVLYVYDPAKPWTTQDQKHDHDPAANPRWLGNFAQAGAHYAHDLVASANGRLYYSGRRERDGNGGGVGYYEPKTGTFAGHHKNLELLLPEGLVVIDALQRVVYSGKLREDPTQAPAAQAELVVYDYDMNEVERQIVKPGLRNTGELFTTAQPGIVIGVIPDEHAIYRYDIGKRKLLDWKQLDGTVGESIQRPSDGSIWIVLDHSLVRIDPVTLAQTTVGDPDAIPASAKHLTWQGNELYMSLHTELRRVPHVGTR